MNPLLELSHVSYSYHEVNGETLALSDISFTLESGSFLAIVGPSGCGKSTLLSLICGLLKPEDGSIAFRGKPLREAGANIGYMLQKDHLFEWRTVYSNVTLGLEIQKKLTPEHISSVDAMLETYGLSSFKDARPSQLSGGMRQRAALARTYLFSRDVMLLDEPFSALDAITKADLHAWFLEMQRQLGLSVLFVTHDIDEAVLLSSRVLVLAEGRIAANIPIPGPTPRTPDFALTPEFLESKRQVREFL